MIDLETLGTKPYSTILNVSAVEFNLRTGETGKRFSSNISRQSCNKFGLEEDDSTLKWWKAYPDVYKSLLKNTFPLDQVCVDFASWLNQRCKHDNKYIWGHRLDYGLLENAFEVVAQPRPWHYFNERDIRALFALHTIRRKVKGKGSKHNPIDDCLWQIEVLCKTVETLNARF